MSQITTFLRYPGSKRRMLNFLGPSLPRSDQISGRYIEPFVGGGSVFFYIDPRSAILSDINPDLIDLYLGIRESPTDVWNAYCAYGSSKEDYHRARNQIRPSCITDRAARVLYLNRTCFKGMWRHNKQGDFNVGYGGQDRRWVISNENLIEVSRRLRNTTLHCCDFEKTINLSTTGDFLFLDPPYRPGSCEQINDHYVSHTFTFADHCRLSHALNRASMRGVYWAMTTSSHPEILDLYSNHQIVPLPRGTGSRPGIMTTHSGEVLIRTN